ncbi:hypothetical protein AGMMS50212_00730 [Spirochaetia bacterium]|nr:hypothetical protein AGMMS50212_00730 [Spirochaetia bacterium]
MDKRTVDERIEEAGQVYKQKLRERMGALMTIEGPNAITLDGIESMWGQINKEAEKLTGEFFNDVLSNNLQNELLLKKNELENAGFDVRNGGKRSYSILTTNGEMRIQKTVLKLNPSDKTIGKNCKTEAIVLDDYFKLKQMPHKITNELTTEVCFWAQNQGSYESAQEILRNKMDINISDEYIRTITMEVGEKVFDDDTKRAGDTGHLIDEMPPKPTKSGVIYVMIDGSMINTREKNDGGSSKWSEIKLAVFFSGNDLIACSNGKRHIIKKKDYAVSTGDVNEFSKYLLECAVRNGYGKYEKVVIVSDGATWIRNLCYDIFPDAIQILDFYHLAEHGGDTGKELFNDEPKKYVPWAETIIAFLRESETGKAIEILSESKEIPSCNQKLITYINNIIEKIDYKRYIRNGYFIGSGPIESANKVVVQRRCKQSGMRWNLSNAGFMLSLRSKVESGLWTSTANRLLSTA